MRLGGLHEVIDHDFTFGSSDGCLSEFQATRRRLSPHGQQHLIDKNRVSVTALRELHPLFPLFGRHRDKMRAAVNLHAAAFVGCLHHVTALAVETG